MDGKKHMDKGYTCGSVEIDGKQFFIQDVRERCVNLFDARLIPMPCADTVSFVYMGMEDGTDAHLGLIRSFAGLHEEYPDVCLYILGEHQMSEETEKEIRDLQLGENVFLMGSVDDPSILIEKCQCTLIPDQISTDGSGEILHTFMERVR